MTKAGTVQNRTMLKGPQGPDPVHPPQHSPQNQQIVQIVELRGVTALLRVEGKGKVVIMEQAFTSLIAPGDHHRQLVASQLKGQIMFLNNLLPAPATRAVELGDQRFAVLNPHLVDPVLVAVKGQVAAITSITLTFDRIHNKVGGQPVEGVTVFVHAILSDQQRVQAAAQ